MSDYRLFFSWQSDRKDTKKIIYAALNTAKNLLKKDGINLIIDQDTRNRTGKRKIDDEVLEKIRNCDIFLADLTPVITFTPPEDRHDLPKHMPNSNVMYEYGYALHAKGEQRMIVLASLNKEEDEHIEYMPFDINHDTITQFTDEQSLKDLHVWIRKIIEDVDLERQAVVPQYACTILFHTDNDFTDEVTIRPQYKKIYYTAKTPKYKATTEATQNNLADLVTNSFKMQQTLLSRMNVVSADVVTAKVITKTTKLSYAPIHLVFVNQGTEALDNLHIHIKPSDSRVVFDDSNVEEKWNFAHVKHELSTFADKDGIFQKANTVNPNATVIFDEVFVHAPHDIGAFKLIWGLSSRTYQDDGELTIHVEPDYEYDYVENDKLAGSESVVDLEISE